MDDGLGDLIADLLGELEVLDELAGLFQQEIAVEQHAQKPTPPTGDVPTHESHSRLTLDESTRPTVAEIKELSDDFPNERPEQSTKQRA